MNNVCTLKSYLLSWQTLLPCFKYSTKVCKGSLLAEQSDRCHFHGESFWIYCCSFPICTITLDTLDQPIYFMMVLPLWPCLRYLHRFYSCHSHFISAVNGKTITLWRIFASGTLTIICWVKKFHRLLSTLLHRNTGLMVASATYISRSRLKLKLLLIPAFALYKQPYNRPIILKKIASELFYIFMWKIISSNKTDWSWVSNSDCVVFFTLVIQ